MRLDPPGHEDFSTGVDYAGGLSRRVVDIDGSNLLTLDADRPFAHSAGRYDVGATNQQIEHSGLLLFGTLLILRDSRRTSAADSGATR